MKKLSRKFITAVFDENESSGYTISVSSLPCLMSEGKNLESARPMAEDALRCYLEGLRKAKGYFNSRSINYIKTVI